MKIRFHLSEALINDMPAEEYEAIEMVMDGNARLYRIRPVLARFMVDDDGKTIPHEQAMKILGKVKLSELKEVMEAFTSGLSETLVPKANGNRSEPPSAASEEI